MSKVSKITGTIFFLALATQWMMAWFWVPVDTHQGEVYRIIYLHVPSAFSAFMSAFVLLASSLGTLRKGQENLLTLSRAATEVGIGFTVLTLATGSIWGKPTWGTWWTWDARLTTTFLLALLFGGWLLLYHSLPSGSSRVRGCAVLGIMIGLDVPIIYKSVTWWRTLHQPQTILRPGGGSTMDGDMLSVLLSGIMIMACVCGWLIAERRTNIKLQEELDEKSLSGVT